MLFKYKEYKSEAILFAGLAWTFIVGPWLNSGFNFLSVLIIGISITDDLYFLIAYLWIPIAFFFWIAFFTLFRLKAKRKMIIIVSLIQAIIYEIIFVYFILTDLSVIGQRVGIFNVDLNLSFVIYVLILLTISLITGLRFGFDSIKSKDAEIRFKGYFIIVAWVSFFIGAILDAGIVPLNPMILILVRIILISSAAEFYCGFFLPRWIKDLLIK